MLFIEPTVSVTQLWQLNKSDLPTDQSRVTITMPAKKDSAGQPPPKPKPEDLIAEFKEKFEKYTTDVRHEASELESKIASLECSQAETRQLVESGHSEQQARVRRLHEDLVHTINHKFGQLEGDIRESFTLLEKKLSEGRFYAPKLTNVVFTVLPQEPTRRMTLAPSWRCWPGCWRRPGTSSSSSRRGRGPTSSSAGCGARPGRRRQSSSTRLGFFIIQSRVNSQHATRSPALSGPP